MLTGESGQCGDKREGVPKCQGQGSGLRVTSVLAVRADGWRSTLQASGPTQRPQGHAGKAQGRLHRACHFQGLAQGAGQSPVWNQRKLGSHPSSTIS